MDVVCEVAPDSVRRAALGGGRLVDLGGPVEFVPDFTRAQEADLECRELPAVAGCERLLAPLVVPGSGKWQELFSTRKVVDMQMADGRMVSVMTSNVADALSGAAPVARANRASARVYELVQLLVDPALAHKFGLRAGELARFRNLASVDAVRAAAELQARVRGFEGCERAVVSAGKYSTSWKAARESLKSFAAGFPVSSVAVDAMFVGPKIFMYQYGTRDGWAVFGPETMAAQVRLVHRLVEASSCESVVFALGMELTILDIDIRGPEGQALSPLRERHAGSHEALDLAPPLELEASLGPVVMSRLRTLGRACETLTVDGVDCATAVRVSKGMVLVNSHVVTSGGTMMSGSVAVVPGKMVTRDLWAARCDGGNSAWHLRPAQTGEPAVLCFRVAGTLNFAGPVHVESCRGDVLTLSRHEGMVPGVSGAAVVSLRDFALLGVYDGVASRVGIAAVFTPEMYSEVCSAQEYDGASHVSATDAAGTVFALMKERGYGKVLAAAMETVRPLYEDDVHVGMAFTNGAGLYTACDPDEAVLSPEKKGRKLTFERVASRGLFRTGGEPGEFKHPAVVRSPNYHERVFVVGRDADGPYCTLKTGRVSHVGVGAELFQVQGLDEVDGLPLAGGLVVAYADCAVLGVYARTMVTRGGTAAVQCYGYPPMERLDSGAEKESPACALRSVFPFLHPEVWPAGVAEAALTHASAVKVDAEVTMVGLAMVGDSAMRTKLWERMLADKIPTGQWQARVQALQSNSVQCRRARALGLDSRVVTAGGTVLVEGSKVFADVVEAVAGAVWLHETREVFSVFCSAVGALGSADE